MSFLIAGMQMPPLTVDNVKLTVFEQDWKAYAIAGDMPYAMAGETVLCIVGDSRAINALWPIFSKAHARLAYVYERRQLYLAAEGGMPKLGYIAKSIRANPNEVMPFFEAWGINLPWTKTEWVPRAAE